MRTSADICFVPVLKLGSDIRKCLSTGAPRRGCIRRFCVIASGSVIPGRDICKHYVRAKDLSAQLEVMATIYTPFSPVR